MWSIILCGREYVKYLLAYGSGAEGPSGRGVGGLGPDRKRSLAFRGHPCPQLPCPLRRFRLSAPPCLRAFVPSATPLPLGPAGYMLSAMGIPEPITALIERLYRNRDAYHRMRGGVDRLRGIGPRLPCDPRRDGQGVGVPREPRQGGLGAQNRIRGMEPDWQLKANKDECPVFRSP